jgi:hypothetical protein
LGVARLEPPTQVSDEFGRIGIAAATVLLQAGVDDEREAG